MVIEELNSKLQFKCTIIRGKSISKMDDLLPVYAGINNTIFTQNEIGERKLDVNNHLIQKLDLNEIANVCGSYTKSRN